MSRIGDPGLDDFSGPFWCCCNSPGGRLWGWGPEWSEVRWYVVRLGLRYKTWNWGQTGEDVPEITHCISRTETIAQIFWLPNSRALPETHHLSLLRCSLTPWYSKRSYGNQCTDFGYPLSELQVLFKWKTCSKEEASGYKPPLIIVLVLPFSLLLQFPSSLLFFSSVILLLSIPPTLSKMLPQISESLFFMFLFFTPKLGEFLHSIVSNLWIRKKTLHPNIPSILMQRGHTDYTWPQIPDDPLVFSDQRNREKIGVQALDLSPDRGSCKVPGKTIDC